MPNSIAIDFAASLRQATLEVIWRQWGTLGATVSSGAPTRTTIDPEALILTSLWMMDHERRLADVIWSWVDRNSAVISIQRLGNLRVGRPPIVSTRPESLAQERVRNPRDARGRSLSSTDAAPLSKRADKIRAVEPRLTSWATLMVQLRMGMGVGVKADVLSFILGLNMHVPEWASVTMIADAIGYTTAAVRRAADDLARARFIRNLDTAESDGGTRMFSGNPSAWAGILGVSPTIPAWGYWRERYRFVIDVVTWHDQELEHATTPYARDVAAREILKRHRTALRRDRIIDPFESSSDGSTLADLAAASEALARFWVSHA